MHETTKFAVITVFLTTAYAIFATNEPQLCCIWQGENLTLYNIHLQMKITKKKGRHPNEKILSLILTLAMTLSLAACASKPEAVELHVFAAAGALTYGSNVKEVTTQVSEGTVDCGIIYATDAASAGLTVVDTATAEMCGQVVYPAAVLVNTPHPNEAKVFLAYLQTESSAKIFEGVGFTPLG